ncbi:MAG TPA: right-handed parallel beta-helix repeat-containing protein, partial [Armatimonadota bacterium]|nr:right-handed parallel beta-helix repeat-containing protein [Armatimonadota bacterium]
MTWRHTFLALIIGGTGCAAEYTVDQSAENASDANPGTDAEPWLTVSHAATTLQPGDTVLVKPGVYREVVSVRVSGAQDRPITFRAVREDPSDRVVITGADAVEDWQPCTSEIAAGNPDSASIQYADIDWKPTRVIEDNTQLTLAREPNEGWFIAQAGGTRDMQDATDLAAALGDLVGGSIWFWDVDTTSHGARPITAFDPATGTLTLEKPIYRDRVVDPGQDRYFLQNRVQLIDQPGEWATHEVDGNTRLFVWPLGEDGLIEASRRGRFVIEWGGQSHVVFDGFELRHGTGHGIGSWTDGSENVTIQNCIIHHNDSDGIHMRNTPGGVIRRNVVTHNYLGVSAGCGGGLVEENEIAYNGMDGLRIGQDSVTVRRNYMHDHVLWGHADNFQLFGGIDGMVFEENLLINGGQQMMMEGTTSGRLLGNMFIGCGAYAVIFGHGNADDYDVIGNTIAFSGYGVLSLTGRGYRVFDNVLASGHGGPLFGYGADSETQSNRNLLWQAPGVTRPPIVYDRNFNASWEEYLADSGQDADSMRADPKFINAPAFFQQMEGKRLLECTKTRVYLRGGTDQYAVGDTVELDFDGVARGVTSVGGDYIDIDPGLDALPMHSG